MDMKDWLEWERNTPAIFCTLVCPSGKNVSYATAKERETCSLSQCVALFLLSFPLTFTTISSVLS